MKEHMDISWIRKQMALKGLNQKKLGKAIGLDPPTVSRMLKGERRLQLSEAAELAIIFEENLDEILVRFGLIADAGVVNLSLSGIIDVEGVVKKLNEQISIPPPQSAIGKLNCMQIRGEHLLDRAIVFFGDSVPVQTDRLALLLLGDHRVLLGIANKGYVPGVFKIKTISGKEFESAVVNCRIIADICPI